MSHNEKGPHYNESSCYRSVLYFNSCAKIFTGDVTCKRYLNSAYWCCLLITFANSFEPDQAQQYVGPDLDLNCLTLMVFLKEFFEKVDFEEISR